MDPFTAARLQRGVEYLHRLGPRANAEFLAEIAKHVGMPCILDLLADYQRRLSPDMLAVTGGDGFPPRFQVVPR